VLTIFLLHPGCVACNEIPPGGQLPVQRGEALGTTARELRVERRGAEQALRVAGAIPQAG
jgi:hypothetical protein